MEEGHNLDVMNLKTLFHDQNRIHFWNNILAVVGSKLFIKNYRKRDSSPIETFFIIPPVESDLELLNHPRFKFMECEKNLIWDYDKTYFHTWWNHLSIIASDIKV